MSGTDIPWWAWLVAAQALRGGGTAISAQLQTLSLLQPSPSIRCCRPNEVAAASAGAPVLLDTTAAPLGVAEQIADLHRTTGVTADLVIGAPEGLAPDGYRPVETSVPGLWVSTTFEAAGPLAACARGISGGTLDAFDLLAELIGLDTLGFRGDGSARLHLPPELWCSAPSDAASAARLHREIPVSFVLPTLGAASARVEIELLGREPCLRPKLVPTGRTRILAHNETGTDKRLMLPIEATPDAEGCIGFTLSGHRMLISRVSLRLENPTSG